MTHMQQADPSGWTTVDQHHPSEVPVRVEWTQPHATSRTGIPLPSTLAALEQRRFLCNDAFIPLNLPRLETKWTKCNSAELGLGNLV